MSKVLLTIMRSINGNRYAFVVFAMALMFAPVLVLASCMPVTEVTPEPYADIAPQPVPQAFDCSITGDNDAFDMRCLTPATPTPEPAFYYFWCDGDQRCASGQFRVYWDRDLSMLRCALPQGDKVTLIANGYSLRVGEGEPLAWVVTGAPAGVGKVCEGWVPVTFLRAAE
mgnify:FL=1